MKLTEIGNKYQTDKATHHKFTDLYDSILSDIRYDKLRVLEIGISFGGSLKMWEEYFINSEIYGCDIVSEEERQINNNKREIYFNPNKTKTFVINQEIKEELLSLPNNLDLIIDDGGHTMLQQQLTLSVMFDKLKSNGIYIIEDLHTSRADFNDFQDYGRTNTNNTINLLLDLKSGLMKSKDYYISEIDFNRLLKEIKSIDIIEISNSSITSIIKKK